MIGGVGLKIRDGACEGARIGRRDGVAAAYRGIGRYAPAHAAFRNGAAAVPLSVNCTQ